MSQLNSDDLFNGLDDRLETTSSRRSMMTCLAALGLVAAGGLAPLAAEAKPKQGGKQDGKQGGKQDGTGKGKGKGHDRHGDGPSAQLDLPDLPDPAVSAPLTIGNRTSALTYPVAVAGTITFDGELLTLMQRGRHFGLTCVLNANDSDPGVNVQLPLSGTSFTRVYWGGSNSPTTGTFKFADMVHRNLLQDDTVTPDDIHAKLYLWTRRNSLVSWKLAKRANGLTYYKTNEISRHF